MKEIILNFEEVDQNYDYYELITCTPWEEVSKDLCCNTFALSRIDSSTLYYNNDKYYQIIDNELKCILPYNKIIMIKKRGA